MTGESRGKFLNSAILPFQFDNLFHSFWHGHKQCAFTEIFSKLYDINTEICTFNI